MRTIVLLLVATILTVATGCDKTKQKEAKQAFADFIDKANGRAAERQPPPPRQLDLAKKPPVLFQVFGGRGDPRLVPIAVVDGGRLRPIVLSRRGWHQFERVYTPPGAMLDLYQDGRRTGTVQVRQSMSQKPESLLYALPGCRLPLPIARVALTGDVGGRQVVEALASNAIFPRARDVDPLPPAEVRRAAREMGLLAASRYGLTPRALDSLDSRVVAVPTGATSKPTLVITYTNSSNRGVDTTIARGARQIVLLADLTELGYAPSYRFYQSTINFAPEFRRYLDHLDLNGDGVDEVILEASIPQRGTSYVVLQYSGGRWAERYRSDPNWCLDQRVAPDSESGN